MSGELEKRNEEGCNDVDKITDLRDNQMTDEMRCLRFVQTDHACQVKL